MNVESHAATIENGTGILSKLKMYKPDQGRYVRMATFWILTFLIGYGCYRLSETLADLRYGWAEWLRRPIINELPLVETSFIAASLVAFAVFLLSIAGLQIILNKQKIADSLIETEGELRKVTWPTFRDTMSASIVVLVCVLILFILLGVYDMAIGKSFDVIFFGK
ncbi:MAG: preprotein translocase subunit SecE [Planctomycetota bacterium]